MMPRRARTSALTPEAARLLLARDPLRHYVPTPTQEQFHRSPAWARMITANNRGGKSAAACADLSWMLRGIHPYRPWYGPVTLIQFTHSRFQAANVIGRKLFTACELAFPPGAPDLSGEPLIPAWEIAELRTQLVAGSRVPHELIMKNGSRLLFSWSGVEDAFKRIAGIKLDGAAVDEDSGNTKLFDELYPRLLDTQSDPRRPWGGFLTWAATNTSYNEAFDSFTDRCERGVAGHAMFVIGANENPAIDPTKRENLREVMSEEAASVRLDGNTTAGELVQIFRKQWSDERHILDAPYEPGPDENLWVAYDPGVDHPMGMLVAAIRPAQPQTLRVVQCWSYRGETIEHDADRLARWFRGRRMAGFVYDANLGQRDRGGGPTVLQRMKELLAKRGLDPIGGYWKSKKSHAPGIDMLRYYLAPQKADNLAAEPLLYLAQPTTENGTGHLRKQIVGYRGKEATRFTGAGGVVKKDDDLVDPLRYLVMIRPTYNPAWACGLVALLDTRVDNLDTAPSLATEPTVNPALDFRQRHVRARSRDRLRAPSWQMVPF